MKIVVAPDKFKGSLPATQVAAAIAAGLHAGRPGAEVVTIPVADGGEGTVDAAVAAGFERVLDLIEEACVGLVKDLQARLQPRT